MEVSYGKGSLLVAAGSLYDPNFQKSVVLLCDHQEAGSYGLVVNQPLPDIAELVGRFPFVKGRLHKGGPVQGDCLQVLHQYGAAIPGALETAPGVWVGGDFARLESGLESKSLAPEICRFYLGYSGWGAGQLAEEFKTGSWMALSATKELVFNTPPDKIWQAAVKTMMADNPIFEHFPANPDWN